MARYYVSFITMKLILGLPAQSKISDIVSRIDFIQLDIELLTPESCLLSCKPTSIGIFAQELREETLQRDQSSQLYQVSNQGRCVPARS